MLTLNLAETILTGSIIMFPTFCNSLDALKCCLWDEIKKEKTARKKFESSQARNKESKQEGKDKSTHSLLQTFYQLSYKAV